jgi:hypothetical protein
LRVRVVDSVANFAHETRSIPLRFLRAGRHESGVESTLRARDFCSGMSFRIVAPAAFLRPGLVSRARAPVGGKRSQEMGLGSGTKVGRQDKRTAAKVALSGCLHIEKHGTTGLADGAIVGSRWLKRLILLA